MTLAVIINGQPVELKPSQMIRSGGEGMVFKHGNLAVKIYHQPQPRHHRKLQEWISTRLQTRLPKAVYGPLALVLDASHQIVGFQMRRLPDSSRPLKRLSQPGMWEKQGYGTSHVVSLFQQMHASLHRIHQQGVVVGDLNDHNVFYDLTVVNRMVTSSSTYWVDVDSYQFGRHPCPAAMLPFVDPALYGIDDLSKEPFFSKATDWYAYLTLLVKCLLQTHPYGGAHHKHKTLTARALSGTSILNPAVTYPARAKPLESLSDELLHHISRVFEKGERKPLPAHLLSQYVSELVTCVQCGLSYPSRRRDCPACRRRTPVVHRQDENRVSQRKLVLQTDGIIEHVAVQATGRILAVVRTGDSYKLTRVGIGGALDEVNLFSSLGRYRFGSFNQGGYGPLLVANPAEGNQLLILDVSERQPKVMVMLETKQFRGSAVFDTSPRNLFRIAGNLIMRGHVLEGQYVEDAIATAHESQTTFWASPFEDVIAGYHRIFAERRFFLIDSQNTCRELTVSPLLQGESLTEVTITFGRKSVGIALDILHDGRSHLDTHLFSFRGDSLHTSKRLLESASDENARLCFPFTSNPKMPTPPYLLLPGPIGQSGAERFHVHPAGVLLREPSRLVLIQPSS